ncbi:uncharacterized protein J4E88_002084 [Alternaria novae-zelandiae]|uniref:uncharacterized protein n=1 Tax=Alternaria metachromatica TaxID=283354 RepID=UPI0020C28287|nr:uncharacterized protein J4E83_000431 [Alternaria metachromatica]XP_049258154.1 uncharacterized protein J4E88_002084 [Alternaria novae-zelandiae]KAI4637614.1 hypothetical protein J4E83_000431 [Alternaria metachromatica]KAI4690612.1 hypothetical protein J4E88_002084 [Alternaria novae-zelandiae]KAI4713240.1 hypothetical protein J4E89_002219 [Alternaria sp. Ai002NY15]
MAYSPNGKGSSGLLPPVSVFAAWPLPNYEDPVTRSKAVLITSCTLGSIMLAVVGARIWARAVIQRNSGVDDWIMLAAMIPTIGLTVTACLATERYNFNRHIWDVHPDKYVPERQVTFALYALYIVAGGMIKISILLFYRRLDSRSITKSFRIATWLNIVAIAIFSIAFVIVLFTACTPFTAFWYQFDITKQLTGYAYHCWIDEAADLLSASIISAVQDAIAAFLPTILYWNLHIPRRQKIALGAIFALGYLVCIVAGVRSYFVWRTFNSPLYDSTWESWPAWLLCVLEIQLGAICASAPALKVFLSHYFKVATSMYSGSSQGTTHASIQKGGGGTWWKSASSGTSGSRGTMASRVDRDGYIREPGNAHMVDEEGGIVLQDTKRSDGRTESIETFIYF